MKVRTMEAFVEDMVSNGVTPMQIKAVAMCCRWNTVKNECYNHATELWLQLKGKNTKNKSKLKCGSYDNKL